MPTSFDLRTNPNSERLPKQAEDEVLNEVLHLDKHRILSLIEKLEKCGIQRVFQQAISKLSGSVHNEAILKDSTFRSWIEMCPFIARTRSSSGTPQLTFFVEWATQARWKYPTHLKVLLTFAQIPTLPWIETLYKLARYCGESKYMVKFAMKHPEVFASIRIQNIEAPTQRTFSLLNEKFPLQRALERLIKNRSMMSRTKEKLADRLQTSNVEAKLYGACKLRLTLHAEMQLLGFYERNPALVPQLRLMGTSKKACYLCHEYLLLHTFSIRVSACHQKIYPTWMPPPCHDIPGGPQYNCFWRLSKKIEKITIKELKSDLEAPQRPRNKDSTAGPSLTMTATVPTEVWERHIAL